MSIIRKVYPQGHASEWRLAANLGRRSQQVAATASLAGLADCGDEADKMASYK
jgi:hypothetical protein